MRVIRRMPRVLLVVALSVLSHSMQAQNSPRHFAPGHEVRLGIGAIDFLFFNAISMDNNHFSQSDLSRYFNTPNLAIPSLDIGNRLLTDNYAIGPASVTGIISADYTYRFKRWFELSGVFSYSGAQQKYYSGDFLQIEHIHNMHMISLLPIAKFIWFRTKYVNMYSSVGLGVSLYVESDEKNSYVQAVCSLHINPVGISVGRRVYGFAELSFGSLGAVRAGVGVRIGKY